MAHIANARSLISYFRACLQEENRDRESMDVFGRGEREQTLLSLPDVPRGETLSVADLGLSKSGALHLNKLERLHQQDFQLMLGLYPVAIKLCDDEGGHRRIRVPAVSVAVSLNDIASGASTQICRIRDLEIHPALRDILQLDRSLDTRTGSLLDAVEASLSALSSPVKVPDNRSSYSLPTTENDVVWGRAGLLWLSRRSLLGRSVLHELERLSQSHETLSRPLRQILQVAPGANGSGTAAAGRPKVGAWLTDAQLQGVINGQRYPLSVINGPPGTGKTHTLAALVLDAVLRDQSILVVCSNDHAADVVRDKISGMLGSASNQILRPGRGDYRRSLLELLDQWLSGERDAPSAALSPRLARRSFIRSRRLSHRRERQWRRITRLEQQARNGSGLVKGYASWRLSRSEPVSCDWHALRHAQDLEAENLDQWLQVQLSHRMATLLGRHRQALTALNTALRSRAAHHRNRRFEALNWSLLTKVFPVWVVSAGALSEVAPLHRELFDMVVLDEATQCNLPQALPALQRGKRAVVVGDPRQLRHFSFVSHSFQQKTAADCGLTAAAVTLDYRSHSLLDYALDALPSPDATTFLDEHFRSRPELIRFCNDTFYGGRLKLVTALRPAQAAPPLQLHECEAIPSGEYNPAEAEQVMALLQKVVRNYRHQQNPPSVGILAMLRGMAVALEKRILEDVPLTDIGRFQLRVGTPYGFQGEERDIMIVAACARPGQSSAARRYLDRPDVFNVAMTRARNHLHLVHTAGVRDEAPNSLLAQYLASAVTRELPATTAPLVTNGAPSELVRWVQDRGIETLTNIRFGGLKLGLVVRSGDTVLCVDTPDERIFQACNPTVSASASYRRLLQRAGIMLFYVSDVQWHQPHQATVIRQQCEARMGLVPSTATDGSHYGSIDASIKLLHRRITQLDTSDLDAVPDLSQLHRTLFQARDQVSVWLNRHFDRSELTWQRYHDASEQLFQQALKSLDGACMVIESYHDLGNPETLLSAIEQKIASCQKAVDALTRLATELATLSTGSDKIKRATAEVERLTGRVNDYRLNDR